MARSETYQQALQLLARALGTGAVVEIAGRALVLAVMPGPVVPRDRSGAWPGFVAREAGIFACCPLWPVEPAVMAGPGCRGWLRLGELDELPELPPVVEWLAGMSDVDLRLFVLGLLHGLGNIADGPPTSPRGRSRPVIRAPENLARELLG